MTGAKRERRERTDSWELIQQWCRMPEQRLYESIRPITLFGLPPAERAQETGLAERTLRRTADAFDSLGMAGLFRPTKQQREDHHRSLPVPMCQLIVDLKAEYPDFSVREIADICYIQFERCPSHNTVKQVLADGPSPSRTTRQYPRYADIPDPAERRLVVIRLHAQGWSVTSIGAYLGVHGLEDKSHANTNRQPNVDLRTRNTIRKLQANPLLGEYRIHGAFLQRGIRLRPRTCGRLMAENRQLDVRFKPHAQEKAPKPHA